MRGIAIIGLGFLLLVSLGANVWQAQENQGLSISLQNTSSQYLKSQQDWNRERAGLVDESKAQQARIADLQLSMSALEQKQTQVQNELESKSEELQQTQEEKSRREEELKGQQSRLDNLTDEFTQLQTSLNQSMSWFRDNAQLPVQTNWNAKNLADRAVEDCVDGTELNLACINHILERTATIAYRTDKDNASRPADHLQSIDETFRTGGGDCEDYSLLLKAVLNTLRTRGDYKLLAWQAGGAGEFRVYPKASLGETEKYWYYPNADRIVIGDLSKELAWVVCFPTTSGSGHCTVAVGGQAPEGRETVPDLTGARVFEPQNGRYLGSVGAEFALCRPQAQNDCWSVPNTIVMVVGDGDFYKVQGRQWNGYGGLYQKIEAEKNASACPACAQYT